MSTSYKICKIRSTEEENSIQNVSFLRPKYYLRSWILFMGLFPEGFSVSEICGLVFKRKGWDYLWEVYHKNLMALNYECLEFGANTFAIPLCTHISDCMS